MQLDRDEHQTWHQLNYHTTSLQYVCDKWGLWYLVLSPPCHMRSHERQPGEPSWGCGVIRNVIITHSLFEYGGFPVCDALFGDLRPGYG